MLGVSEYRTTLRELIQPSDFIFSFDELNLLAVERPRAHLVVVAEYCVIDDHGIAVVSDDHATGAVAEDAVSFHFGKAAAGDDDTAALVLVDVVIEYVRRAVEENDAVVVVVDVVVHDPAIAAFYHEDAFGAT